MSAPSATDLTGYRSDGGGLGQDQGLTPQLKRILTSKLPLLNAPGSVVENSLYYDTSSATVTAVEMQNYFAKDRMMANSNVIGASPTFFIPSVLFTGLPYWVFQFADILYPNAFTNGRDFAYNQPHGYGFWAISSINLYLGAGNIAQLQYDGWTNFMIAMACCETDEKRNVVLWGAGIPATNIAVYTGTLGNQMAPPEAGQSLWRAQSSGNFFTTDTGSRWDMLRTAAVPIRVPWASLVALDKRLPLDCKLLTQPITLVLNTRNLNDTVFYNPVGWTSGNTPSTVLNFSTLQPWQQELSDKSLSVRSELLAMPEFNIALPAQMPQSIPILLQPANSNGQIMANLTSLINSDLTTMLFMVTCPARQIPGPNFCPLYGELIYDIELLLNGQFFFRFDSEIYNVVQMCNMMTTTQPKLSVVSGISGPGNTTTAAMYQFRGNIYEFNFARLRSLIGESHMQNTARFTNQTFQLRFKVNTLLNWGNIPVASRAGFSINMSYWYNSCYLIGGNGGTSTLITA
jgi:hypothetical protein